MFVYVTLFKTAPTAAASAALVNVTTRGVPPDPPVNEPMTTPPYAMSEPEMPIWPAPMPWWRMPRTSSALSDPAANETVSVAASKSDVSMSVTSASPPCSMTTAPSSSVYASASPSRFVIVGATLAETVTWTSGVNDRPHACDMPVTPVSKLPSDTPVVAS